MKNKILLPKSKIFLLLLLMASLLTGCEKDTEPPMHPNDDSVWIEGQPVLDKQQKVFVEKYSGMRCPNCPSADTTLLNLHNSFGDRMIVVSVHAGSLAIPYSGNIDLRTDVGTTWKDYFGITSYPSMLVNRSRSNGLWSILSTSTITGSVNTALQTTPSIALALNVSYDAATRKVSATVNLEFLQTLSDNLTVTLLVTEDSLVGEQLTPTGYIDIDYVYNHVLRDVITDVWGADIDADGNSGTCRTRRFQYTLKEGLHPEKCHIVAFISDKESREILQVAQVLLY